MKLKQLLFVIFLITVTFFGFGSERKIDLMLFRDTNAKISYQKEIGREVIIERYVKLNPNGLSNFPESSNRGADGFCQALRNELHLNLFDDTYLKAYLSEMKENSNGSFSWVGKAESYPGSSVILVVNGDMITGSVHIDNRSFKISPMGNGIHRIAEIDSSQYAECMEPIPVYSDTEYDEEILSDTGNNIDVLVAYTSTARAAAGSVAAIENLINLAIAESNTGYSNSGVNQRLNLVHTVEYGYSEASFNWRTTLSRLRGKNDGYMDGIHALRNTYGADMVMLIVNNTKSCGLAYLMSPVSASFKSSAFSLVSRTCATGYYSFAHELGHNMGSQHDRANAGSAPAYSYSYGFQSGTRAFRTIMAYNCPGGCSRVNYWSNPNNHYGGEAMGVDWQSPTAADNRRSLNATLSTVRNFRQHISNATITVTSPVSGNSWTKGSTHNITWTKTGTQSSNIKINVFKNSISSGNFVEQLTGPNNGSYNWTVPSSYTSGNYILRIKTTDNKVYDDSDVFAITGNSSSPTITVTSPVSGNSWAKGSTHNITWTKRGTQSANVKINIFRGSIAVANFVEQLTGPNNGSYNWTVPISYTSGNYILRIKTTDNKVYDDSDIFAITN